MCWKRKPKKNMKEEANAIKVEIHRVFEQVDRRRMNFDAKIDALEKELEKKKSEIKAKRKLLSETQLTTMLDNYEMEEKKCNMLKAMRDPFLNLSNVFFEIDYMADYCCNLGVYSALVKTMDKKTRKKLEELISGMDDLSDRKQISATTELVKNKISDFMFDLKVENERAADNLTSLVENAKSDRDNEITKKSANDRFADMFGDDEEEATNNNNAANNADVFVKPIAPDFNNNNNNADNSRKANNN